MAEVECQRRKEEEGGWWLEGEGEEGRKEGERGKLGI